MIHLEEEKDFDSIIGSGKVVVDFYADWCGPCKMLGPVVEEVSKEHKDITFLKVNVDDFGEIAMRFGIMSIPCIKVFEDGNEIKSNVGFMDKNQFEDFIK